MGYSLVNPDFNRATMIFLFAKSELISRIVQDGYY